MRVTTEIAFALVLLIGAALMVQVTCPILLGGNLNSSPSTLKITDMRFAILAPVRPDPGRIALREGRVAA